MANENKRKTEKKQREKYPKKFKENICQRRRKADCNISADTIRFITKIRYKFIKWRDASFAFLLDKKPLWFHFTSEFFLFLIDCSSSCLVIMYSLWSQAVLMNQSWAMLVGLRLNRHTTGSWWRSCAISCHLFKIHLRDGRKWLRYTITLAASKFAPYLPN